MRAFKALSLALCLTIMAACGGGGGSTGGGGGGSAGGGGGGGGGAVPITASITTVPTGGTTAVGTITLAGPTTPVVYGIDLSVSLPAGASISSATPSGVAAGAAPPEVNGQVVALASSDGFGSGEILKVNFVNVPAGGNFGVSVLAAYDGSGATIQ